MIEYVDNKGNRYASLFAFKRKHPNVVCPALPEKDLLTMLGLVEEEVPDPEPDVEEARTRALEDLNRTFLDFRQNKAKVKSSLGFVVDATERALIDVSGLVAITEASGAPIVFRDAENKPHELDHGQLLELRKEIALAGSANYEVKWRYRDRILTATTANEISAIRVRFKNNVE